LTQLSSLRCRPRGSRVVRGARATLSARTDTAPEPFVAVAFKRLPLSTCTLQAMTDRPTDLVNALARLVATLDEARGRAVDGPDHLALGLLLARARAELDVADEKLLSLDRNRRRSAFRQAGRIRRQLDALEDLVAAVPPGAQASPPQLTRAAA